MGRGQKRSSPPSRIREKSVPSMSESVFFACRRCGQRLFDHSSISHDVQGNQNAMTPYTNISSAKTDWVTSEATAQTKCTSIFIASPPSWTSCADANEGRINCPKCTARVGNFKWSGTTCSCGKWITPSFQFQLARIDPKGSLALQHISSTDDSKCEYPAMTTALPSIAKEFGRVD